MIINGIEIGPGERKLIRIPIEELPTHTLITMPVWVFRSAEPGPTLLITAGLHGDETNGTEILRRMIRNKSLVPETGTVIALPVANIYGFIHRSRSLPDGRDMNRSFPGSRKGSLARRLAYTLITEILPHADIGLDLHTGGANRSNYPQIRCLTDQPLLVELGKVFGAPFLLHSPLIDQSFRKAAWKLGKPILVFEGGESLRLDEFAIEQGILGARRLMHHLGMHNDGPERAESLLLNGRGWTRAPISGMFRALVQTGDKVEVGQVLGTLADPYGETEKKIKSTRNAFVIGINNDSVVHAGSALFHLGWVVDPPKKDSEKAEAASPENEEPG